MASKNRVKEKVTVTFGVPMFGRVFAPGIRAMHDQVMTAFVSMKFSSYEQAVMFITDLSLNMLCTDYNPYSKDGKKYTNKRLYNLCLAGHNIAWQATHRYCVLNPDSKPFPLKLVCRRYLHGKLIETVTQNYKGLG